MSSFYEYKILNPNFDNLGYLKAIANLQDKHDRSAPSNYHWKVLKCRMIIFSSSSILSCPDKSDIKQIHLIFNKIGDDFDRLNSLFLKFSLVQDGGIHQVSTDIYSMCFLYTMSAKIAPVSSLTAPVWNYLGENYYVNNRDFLKSIGPEDGIQFKLSVENNSSKIELKPVKIHLVKSKDKFLPGENITVLPSLNKAVIEEYYEILPKSADFKCYKDLRRHWKNIHGYRLPEEEYSYYTVRFWRGDPLTYPEICLLRSYPIITPLPKYAENEILSRFINTLKVKMPFVLCVPLTIESCHRDNNTKCVNNEKLPDTQTLSLCTPTQDPHKEKYKQF